MRSHQEKEVARCSLAQVRWFPFPWCELAPIALQFKNPPRSRGSTNGHAVFAGSPAQRPSRQPGVYGVSVVDAPASRARAIRQPPRTQEPPPLPAAAALDAAGKPVTASSAAGCFRSLPSAARGRSPFRGVASRGAWSPESSAHWAPRTRPRPVFPRLRTRKPDWPNVCVRARGGVSFRGLVRRGAGAVRGGLG